ncbi:MAG: hypothetical protein GX133_11420 [Syntrophomonadaceae bacterium]|nr:hypothetical protein [Syntrophomonadaceae bacterium]
MFSFSFIRQSLRRRVSQTHYNQYSVRLELPANYYVGVWAGLFRLRTGFFPGILLLTH